MLRRPHTSDYKPRRASKKRTVRTLLSPEQLNQALSRESSRVDRSKAGPLALVLFRLAHSKRNRFSSIRLAKMILRRIRVTDDLGWFDRDHLGLLLPDTTQSGAWQLAQSVCESAAQRGQRPLFTMYVYSHPQQETAAAPLPQPAMTQVKVAS